MDNEGKLPDDFVALKDTMIHCEHQLEVPLFQPFQPYDLISHSCSYDFLLGYGVRSYSCLFNQIPFEGMADPLLHPLIINSYLKTRDAFGGDMVFNDASFLLAPPERE